MIRMVIEIRQPEGPEELERVDVSCDATPEKPVTELEISMRDLVLANLFASTQHLAVTSCATYRERVEIVGKPKEGGRF